MAESLYGVKDASKTKHKPISSSTSLAFSSNLSALISSTAPKAASSTSVVRPRPPKVSKSDIFTSHNKNVKKRSAADLEQAHQTKHDIGFASTSEYHRSKRKMGEKVRLYNAMKRGEYIGREDHDDRGLVDFDRKWADSQTRGSRDSASENGSESGSDSKDGQGDDRAEETVEYLDEFGRLRKGTSAEVRRLERSQRIAAAATTDSAYLAAHPQMPENVIYGDTVQHQAFNPDRVVAEKMEELAKKRDKAATPPPETHYDANGEIRNRGTGFYGFSKDEELRKKEMEELEKEREATERVRKESQQAKEKRKQEIEERRNMIAQKRSQKEADRFLDKLELDGS